MSNAQSDQDDEQRRSFESVDGSALTPPVVPKQTLRMLNFATSQELDDASDPASIGYSARVWAQVSLPYRNPGDVPYWERRNGNVSLLMRPALLKRADGTRYEAYPFGLMPRHALTWIASEAVRTNEPVMKLGSSMSDFMRRIGLHLGGKDAGRLTDQLRRLFDSRLSVQGLINAEDVGTGEFTKYFQIADTVQLWFSKNDALEHGSSTPLWSSEVTLSNEFFQSIVEAPVPVNLQAMKALGSSAMRLDIYLWVTYRMFTLRRETKIPWTDLNHQFGGQYANVRQFKAQFIKKLAEVKIVYPEMNVEPTKDYLILRPSQPHVKPTKRRRELE